MKKENTILNNWLELITDIRDNVTHLIKKNNGEFVFTDEMTKTAKFWTNFPVTTISLNERTSGSICVKYDGKETAWICFDTDKQLILYRIMTGSIKQ